MEKEEENSTLVCEISRLESDAQGEQLSWRRCPSQLDENSLLKIIRVPKMTESLKFNKLIGFLYSEKALSSPGQAYKQPAQEGTKEHRFLGCSVWGQPLHVSLAREL